jgi:hypothetical protein
MRAPAFVFLSLLPLSLAAADAQSFRLKSSSGLELHGVTAEPAVHQGRAALRLTETPAPAAAAGTDRQTFAVISDSSFADGVIEAEVAGKPAAGAPEAARGFVGIAFHINEDASKFECFYLRPVNGRANDQLQRNRSTQYFSYPDHPWYLLRKESPGVYESYADLVTGAWTKIRIEVDGKVARLYLNGGEQPALIVNDLKLGAGRGRVALWIGQGSEAYFSRVDIRPR